MVGRDYPHLLSQLEAMQAVFRRYLERKVHANAMDYDDLLLNWMRLLETHHEVSKPLALRFRSRPRRRVPGHQPPPGRDRRPPRAARAAQPHGRRRRRPVHLLLPRRRLPSILVFPDRYPDAAIFRLETNYRSTPRDPRARQRLDRTQRAPVSKDARAARDAGVPGRRLGARRRRSRPSFVAQRILELRDEGTPLSEIARPLPRPLPLAGAADRADRAGTSLTRSAPGCASSSRPTSRTSSPTFASSRTRRTRCRSSGR